MPEEPLLVSTIACPACEEKVPLLVANPRLYTVAGRESDRHVTGYRWIRGTVTTVVPHHYRIWQCPKCLFADFADAVGQEAPGGDRDTLRTTFMDISLEKKIVLDTLRDLVPAGPMTQVGAIAIHLAALLITGLPTEERQINHAKRARVAMRLGWLYRELDTPSAEAPAEPSGQAMRALAEATENLDRLTKEAAVALVEVQQKGRLRGQELRLPDKSEANPYLALGELIDVRLKTLQAEVATLQMAVLHDQQGRLEPATPEVEAAVGDAMGKVVQTILPFWPEVPRTERQCLILALEALEYSYQFERGGENEEQGLVQVNLILDLLVRLGHLERALDWTAQTAQFAMDTVSDLQKRITKGKSSRSMTAYDENVINRKIAAMDLTRQKAGESRRDILDLMLERDRDKIEAILAEHPQATAQERATLLTAAGIHGGVAGMLPRDRNPRPKEEAGWFKKWLNS